MTARKDTAKQRGHPSKQNLRGRAALDAAAAEFARRGFLGTSTAQIAQRLGLKQGSLYYYFPSKQRALELVCQLSTEAMLGGLSEIAAHDGDPREKIRRAVAFHVDWLAGQPDYCWTFLRERKHVTGPAGRLLAETARRYERLFEAIFRQGVARGCVRADCRPAHTAFATLAMINAFSLQAQRQRRPLPPGTARWIADLVLGGVAAEPGGMRVGRAVLEPGRGRR